MDFQGHGELVPVGGGDPIPLPRTPLVLGRRESCDICLRFPNVSGRHCELSFKGGFWVLKDLDSTNGVKVNGERVQQKVLRPGDTIKIAKREFTINYTPSDRLSTLEDDIEDLLAEEEEIMGQSLLEKAGLERPDPNRKRPTKPGQRFFDEDEDDEDD